MKKNIVFQKFKPENFQEYKSWFKDLQIKNALGHIDEEWLNFILNDEKGIEYAVLRGEELIGVIGLNYPSDKEPSYTITNIAIKPSLKNNGIGSKILTLLLKRYTLKENEYWVSYVEKENKNGQRFFEKNGWSKINEKEMIKYILN